jgi:dolichol-phosphate mannosyltransferase
MPRSRKPAAQPTLELTVVVPTRNEAGNVPLLIQRLRNSLAEFPFDVLFVDDSDDSTTRVLREATRRDPRISLVHRRPQERAGGLSTAVVAGLARARGRLACVMDGDLQHPPELIPEMVARAHEGADLVVASRYLPGATRRGLGSWSRRLVSRGATLVARTLFLEARASTDPLAGFFLCRTDLVRGLEFRPVGFKILLELLVCTPGARVAEVPLHFQPRGAGESKATVRQGWLYLCHLWSLVRDVPGSARRWKFAAVGLSGLAILLAILQFVGVTLAWSALLAWAAAFAISLLWNTALNLRITFADLHRERSPLLRRYLLSGLGSGAIQLLAFLALRPTGLPLVLEGLLAAVLGMAVNAWLSLRLVRWGRRVPDVPVGSLALLQRLARAARADHAALLGTDMAVLATHPGEQYRPTRTVRDLWRRAGSSGRAIMWTTPPSGRAQARSSVAVDSIIVIPVASGSTDRPRVVLLRHRRTPFTSADLDAAMRQLRWLSPPPAEPVSPRVTSPAPRVSPDPAR